MVAPALGLLPAQPCSHRGQALTKAPEPHFTRFESTGSQESFVPKSHSIIPGVPRLRFTHRPTSEPGAVAREVWLFDWPGRAVSHAGGERRVSPTLTAEGGGGGSSPSRCWAGPRLQNPSQWPSVQPPSQTVVLRFTPEGPGSSTPDSHA